LGFGRDDFTGRAEEAYDRAPGRPDPSFPDPHPRSRGAEGPEATGRPRGRRTALTGFHGSSEVRGRNVAPHGFGAPGKPFRRRSGVPFRSAGQRPSPRASPLSTSRAPEGALRRSDAGPHGRLHPPQAPTPSAHEEPRIRSSRACRTRHLPPSAFRTPSAACTPRPRPGLFHPGNAPGVSPSGPCSSPGARASLEARLLSCRSPPAALATPPGARSSELSSPRRVRAAGDRKSPAADALLAFSPLGPSLPPRGSRIFPPPRALADARQQALPAPPPLRFRRTIGFPRRPTGAPESSPAETSAFPPPASHARSRGRDLPEQRRRPFWGSPPRPGRPAEAALGCR